MPRALINRYKHKFVEIATSLISFPSRNNQLYSFSKGSVEPIIDYGSPVTSFHLADSSVTFPPAKGAMQLNRHLHAKFKEKREIKKKTRTNSGAKLNKKLTLTNKRSEAHTGRIRDTTSGPKLQSIWKCIELSWGVGSEEVARQTNVCQQNALKQMEI